METLFDAVNNILFSIIEPELGRIRVTMLNDIVDNFQQCGQQNIAQCCFHQLLKGSAFLCVYRTQQTANIILLTGDSSYAKKPKILAYIAISLSLNQKQLKMS